MMPEAEDTLFSEVINLELEMEAIGAAIGDGEPSDEQAERMAEIHRALEKHYMLFDNVEERKLSEHFMVPL